MKKTTFQEKKNMKKANATFDGRNSYSKTDEDAAFMRMKEDAMLNDSSSRAITFRSAPRIIL